MFLDTSDLRKDLHRHESIPQYEKLPPVHRSSQILKRYKINSMTSDLNKAARMASGKGNEIPAIKLTFLNAD